MSGNQTIELKLPLELQKQLERVEQKLDQFIKIGGTSVQTVGDYVTEDQAKKLLGKKTTWFYYQRRDGYLKSYKVGQKNFYKLSELEKLIERGQAK